MLSSQCFQVPELQGKTGFHVLRADTQDLSDLVYRFRYHVYVEQMRRRQIYADHDLGTILEPMDERGDNYLGVKDGSVIGVVRRNMLDDPATAYYAKFYRADLFNLDYKMEKMAITTKLMMLPAYRQSTYPIRLIHAYAADGYRNGVQLELLDCNKGLVTFFEKMGYFSYRGWGFHKEFGTVRPMFFAVDALAYLEEINSFLKNAAGDIIVDGQYGGYKLISSIAETPWNERIRDKSAPFRGRV